MKTPNHIQHVDRIWYTALMARIIVASCVGSVIAVLAAIGITKLLGMELTPAVIAAIGGAVGAVSGVSMASQISAEENDTSDNAES